MMQPERVTPIRAWLQALPYAVAWTCAGLSLGLLLCLLCMEVPYLLWPTTRGITEVDGSAYSYTVRSREFSSEVHAFYEPQWRVPAGNVHVTVHYNPIVPKNAYLEYRLPAWLQQWGYWLLLPSLATWLIVLAIRRRERPAHKMGFSMAGFLVEVSPPPQILGRLSVGLIVSEFLLLFFLQPLGPFDSIDDWVAYRKQHVRMKPENL